MQQLRLVTARGCVAAAVLGVLFTFITLRLTLGSAGMTPPLTVPGGLLSYALLQAYTRLVPRARPFTAQENAVVQTMATSCYKIVGFAGYSSYLTALSYAVYLQLGGVPAGQPGYDADSVIEPELRRVYPYLVCIAFGGIFVLLGLRVLLIVRWRLPFPSGTASGSMINSLHAARGAAASSGAAAVDNAGELHAALDAQQHLAAGTADLPPAPTVTADSRDLGLKGLSYGDDSSRGSSGTGRSPEQLAARKVKVLAYTALGSFLFDVVKWLFQGSSPGCGFANWPTFGLAAAKWTWQFDFQQQYIGSGFLVPHIVAWSMLLGAILSWGLMWPLLSVREGDWFPAGLSFGDMRGLAGYKIWLSVALLLGEGAFILAKAALLGYRHLNSRRRQRLQRGLLPSRHSAATDNSNNSAAGRSTEWCFAQAQPDKLGEVPTDSTCTNSSSSTSCSLHCSVDAAAMSADTLRYRTTTSAEFSRQQHQHLTQQQQVLHPQHIKQEQQQQRQVGTGCIGVLAAADAVAVVPDDDPSTSGHAGHTKGTTAAAGVCRNSISGAGSGSSSCSVRRRGPAQRAAGGADSTQCAEGGGVAGATFQETHAERRAREAVFLSDSIPSWLGPAGYCLAAGVGVAFIPLIYPPARWYMVLTAFLLGPAVALVNGFGVGLTDVDNSANYSTVAMFLFAAWASNAAGIVAGCVLSGVLMVFSVSAAVLLQDLRTGYITLTPPSPLLLAQVLGAAFGVLFSPLAFALFWSAGQVGLPDGPYPAPFAAVTRGIASIGVLGFGALPRYCVALSGVFFVAAFGICVVRDVLPVRYGRFVPSPMGMAFPFFIPASTALDYWCGSVIVMLWEWRAPQSAAHYAPLAGAGLLVGDGLWSIPAAVLALANVSPPMCMKFT